MLKDAQASTTRSDHCPRRTLCRLLLAAAAVAALANAFGCKATPLDQWRAMSSSRLQPLTERQVAALDEWKGDEPVTTVVRAGEVR